MVLYGNLLIVAYLQCLAETGAERGAFPGSFTVGFPQSGTNQPTVCLITSLMMRVTWCQINCVSASLFPHLDLDSQATG